MKRVTEKPLSRKLSVKDKQNYFRADAVKFFEWCRHNLSHHLEKLDAADRREFESGKISKKIFDVVRAAWSDNLKSHLPWDEHFAVIRNVLTDPRDYDAAMNCSMHLLPKLPKRIRTAVANGEKERAQEIHTAFFANDGEKRLTNYLRVWQSQERAKVRMMLKALGRKYKPSGGASLGGIPYDAERMFLTEVEAARTSSVRGLFAYVTSLWEANSPYRSEVRLNRFLIKLGRALASTKNRRQLSDWLNGVDQTERFVVEGWCESITVDGETWPMLCFFTTRALVKFLKLCNVKHCKLAESRDSRSIERAIQRLGLVRLPRDRVKHVEKRLGQFRFS